MILASTSLGALVTSNPFSSVSIAHGFKAVAVTTIWPLLNAVTVSRFNSIASCTVLNDHS